jgi:hypothetical protein
VKLAATHFHGSARARYLLAGFATFGPEKHPLKFAGKYTNNEFLASMPKKIVKFLLERVGLAG